MEKNYNLMMTRIFELRAITEPYRAYTRRAFTEIYQQGRSLICQWLDEMDIDHWFDTAGNLHARIEGASKSTVYFGSHSDTVPEGGAYDGVLGIVAGIELLSYVKRNQIPLNLSLEFIDFLAEETTDWGLSCIGSRALTGQLSDDDLMLRHPETGQLLKDAIDGISGNFSLGFPALALTDQDCFIELHIEQGPVLERRGLDIGIVNSIVGITRLKLDIQGVSNHSGTTPMSMRQDALVMAANIIGIVHDIGIEIAEDAENQYAYFVATVGKIVNIPNAINVVPGQAEVYLDLRTTDHIYTTKFIELLQQHIDQMLKISSDRNLPLTMRLSVLSQTEPAYFDKALVQLCEELVKEKGFKYQIMTSGAGHDAAFMVQKMKAMMIFIPSHNGISHNVKEHSTEEDIQRGYEVFRDLVLRLSGSLCIK